MKRRAILIGSNTATISHLNGVDFDIRRLNQHLLSEFGGAWEQEEIYYHSAPSVGQLRKRLNNVRDERPDFLMIAFSGHGFVDEQKESVICLSDNENFAVKNLQIAVDRQVTIVDACRVIVRGALVEGVVKTAGTGDVSGIDDWDYRASCRARFDARLLAVAAGRALLQSCSLGQVSSDYSTGGLFTHSLIKSVRTVAFSNSDWQQSTKSWSVAKSFAAAKQETQRLNLQQLPTFTMWDQGDKLPFVVA